MNFEEIVRDPKKKYIRVLSRDQLEYLAHVSPNQRIYVNSIDGCYGGFASSVECEGCLVYHKCSRVKTIHKTGLPLIGHNWGWREAGSP